MITKITIQGTHCAACKALLEDVCKEIPGVKSCDVDFKTGMTAVEHEQNIDWAQFKKVIEDLGRYKIII